MNEPVTLYQLRQSSNNIKIRIALNYKGIPFDRVDVDPNDRSEVVKVSGQPLTPVLVHGNRVIFDSGSILRYIDANFHEGARLFSTDYDTMKVIEKWETWARTELVQAFYIAMGQFRSPVEQRNPAESKRASDMLQELTGKIEAQLEKTPWLAGDSMTAADITAAPLVNPAIITREQAGDDPRLRFYVENLRLGDGRQRTAEWARKVMEYDRQPARA
jgi:glutathione S-transferase